MRPDDESPFTPRERRGLAFAVFTLVVAVLAIFIGLNIHHVRELRHGNRQAGVIPGAGS